MLCKKLDPAFDGATVPCIIRDGKFLPCAHYVLSEHSLLLVCPMMEQRVGGGNNDFHRSEYLKKSGLVRYSIGDTCHLSMKTIIYQR